MSNTMTWRSWSRCQPGQREAVDLVPLAVEVDAGVPMRTYLSEPLEALVVGSASMAPKVVPSVRPSIWHAARQWRRCTTRCQQHDTAPVAPRALARVGSLVEDDGRIGLALRDQLAARHEHQVPLVAVSP